METSLVIHKATKEGLLALCEVDFTWKAAGRFDVTTSGEAMTLLQTVFDQPLLRGNNDFYHEEIRKYASYCDQPDSATLVAILDGKPVGYLSASVEEWSSGKVINGEGILVACEHRGAGIAKALITALIENARTIEGCRGIMVEMDTEKYEANRLLLSMGFVFAGTRLFIYSGKSPVMGSKEALYFYYSL
jgi:GNAT superfamily N-acetyltransferase